MINCSEIFLPLRNVKNIKTSYKPKIGLSCFLKNAFSSEGDLGIFDSSL